MHTVLTLTITCTDGPPSPELIASAERYFGIPLTVSGNQVTGELTLADGTTIDELVERLRAVPGVEIVRDEVIDVPPGMVEVRPGKWQSETE